jgi:hypothetical protein
MALSRWNKRFGGNVIPDRPGTILIDADDMKQNVIARMAMSSVVAERLGGQGVYDGGAYSISDIGGSTSTTTGPGTPSTTDLNTASNFNTTNLITDIVAADGKLFVSHEDDVWRWTSATTWVQVGTNIFSSQKVSSLCNHNELLYAAEERADATAPKVKVYNGITSWTTIGSLSFAHSLKKIYSMVSHNGSLCAAAGEKVFEYSGTGTTWTTIGDFSSLNSGVARKLVSYRGNLYVAVLTDDSVNNKVSVYRYTGGTNWVEIGAWNNSANPGVTPNNGMDIYDFIASDENIYISLLFYDGAGAADTTYTGVYKYLGNNTWAMMGTSKPIESMEYYNGKIHAFGDQKHLSYVSATNTWLAVATYTSAQFPAAAQFDYELQFVAYDSTNKNVAKTYAEQVVTYTGGTKYPAATLIIYDDDARAWFFLTDDETDITFLDTDTANGELWARVRVIGDSTAARGGVAEVDFVAKDNNNTTTIYHGLLLGTGKISNSGFNTFYTSQGSFVDSSNSSINFSLAGDKDESQVIVWNNQTVNIKGGLGVASTLNSATATVSLDIDLAEYPGLEVVSDELKLKLDASLEISPNNELVLTDESGLVSFDVVADTGSETLTLGNILNVIGNNGISSVSQDTDQLILNLDNPLTGNHTWSGKQYFKEDVTFDQAIRLRDFTNQYISTLQAEELAADTNIGFLSLDSLDIDYTDRVPMYNMAWTAPAMELKWTTGAQALASDDYQWNIVNWDDDTTTDDNIIWRNVAGQKHLVTIGENAEGWYLIEANIGIASDANGIREIKFDGYNSFLNNNVLSGADYWSETFTAVNGKVTVVTCQALMYLSPGDNFYVKILQDSGSALNIATTTENNSLKLYRVF